MTKKILFSFMLFMIFSALLYAEKTASITINYDSIGYNTVHDRLFGTFLEYQPGRINGRLGLGAQALCDRGFDDHNISATPVTEQWKLMGDTNTTTLEYLDWQGYNPKGYRHYKVSNIKAGQTVGLYQNVFLEPNTDYEFFIYMKGGLDSGQVYLTLADSITQEVLYHSAIGLIQTEWQRYELLIPKLKNFTTAKVLLSFSGQGEVNFDESSLLPSNNKYTMSKWFYDMMKELNPGMLRFPGGCFADYLTFRWKNHIGPREQRAAPNYWWDFTNLRMDFSIDECLQFCEELNIEPLLTVNYQSELPEDAADFVEYCNGSINTEYGALRAKNGHPEPYNVKYWEVGNEQWTDTLYTKKYLDYFHAMKAVDSSINITVNGNHWEGPDNVKEIFDVIGDNADTYSWHPLVLSIEPPRYHSDTTYQAVVSAGNAFDYDMNWIAEELFKKTAGKVKHAPNEWWVDYLPANSGPTPWIDTTWRNSTLESGLANTQLPLSAMRHGQDVALACRTLLIGFFQRGINKKNERVFFGSPGYYALKMLYKHHGQDLVNIKLDVDTLEHIPIVEDLPWIWHIPMLDVVATMSEDSLFLAVVNRDVSEPYKTKLNLRYISSGTIGKAYELYSKSYLDYNSADNPENVINTQKEWQYDGEYTFPEHSFTILALPINRDFIQGIPLDSTTLKILLYPNPSSGLVRLFTYSFYYDDIQIYDITGKMVYAVPEAMLENRFIDIDMKAFSHGTYFVKATKGKEFIIEKMIFLK